MLLPSLGSMNPTEGKPQQNRTKRLNEVPVAERRAIFRRLMHVVERSGLSDAEFARAYNLPHSLPGKWRKGLETGVGPLPGTEVLRALSGLMGTARVSSTWVHGMGTARVSSTWVLTGHGPQHLGEVLEAETLDEYLSAYLAGEVTHRLGESNVRHAGITIRPRAALAFLVDTAEQEARLLLDHLPLVILAREWGRLSRAQRGAEVTKIAKVAPTLAAVLSRIGVQVTNGAQPLERLPRQLPATHVVGCLVPESEPAAPIAPEAPPLEPRAARPSARPRLSPEVERIAAAQRKALKGRPATRTPRSP
jgi:hypothetical protein